MGKPYAVLTTYHPPKLPGKDGLVRYRGYRIGKDLVALVESLGLKPFPVGKHKTHPGAAWSNAERHAEVRKTAVSDSEGTQWHQDGDTTGADMNCGLVLWSDTHPTQFKTPDGKVYQPKPFEVVAVRNLSCHHRRPNDAPSQRWSFRQRIT
jgi:hypothetical protein